MKDKIKIMLEQNKIGFIFGAFFFTLFFIFLLLLTINAFSGGKLFGEKKNEYSLGTCSYGDIRYQGEMINGQPNGEGTMIIDNDKSKIELIAHFSEGKIQSGVFNITNYEDAYNAVITGTFGGNGILDIDNGYIRFEDGEDNWSSWEGEFKDGNLSGLGEVYYMLNSVDKGYCRIGNYQKGRLVTPTYIEDVVLSELPPEEETESKEN